jgi:hypothetical protein
MNKLTTLVSAFVLAFFSVNAQEQNHSNNPNEKIIVNKEFDENGNLIGYDSTYVNSWSSDSTFQFNFNNKDFFNHEFPDINEMLNNFFGDSILHNKMVPGFPFSPFDEYDFFGDFNFPFNDSVFMKGFELDSLSRFNHDFIFPDKKEFEKQIQEYLNQFHNQQNLKEEPLDKKKSSQSE